MDSYQLRIVGAETEFLLGNSLSFSLEVRDSGGSLYDPPGMVTVKVFAITEMTEPPTLVEQIPLTRPAVKDDASGTHEPATGVYWYNLDTSTLSVGKYLIRFSAGFLDGVVVTQKLFSLIDPDVIVL